MNRFASSIVLSIGGAVVPLMTGCGESSAPAMTQTAPSQADHAAPAEQPLDAANASDGPEDSQAVVDDASPAATADSPAPAGENRAAEVTAATERTRDITFDDLKFDIDKGDPFERSLLTEKIESLDGKPVCIRGFILPSFQQTGLTQFVLVRDNLSCCFGPGAAIYDCAIVEMKPGRSTDFSIYPVAVTGTFTIREMLDPDGKTVAIYHLDGEQVR
ncbi:MAG TPA: hypothetical protein VHC22_18650 [Pirellulales bacterium]|nr:hypothetical protein [Pirellulales bacterium]